MHLIIFKTSVAKKRQARKLLPLLEGMPLVAECNFDLDDCDKILRVVSSKDLHPKIICQVLNTEGFMCETLGSFAYNR